MRLTASDQKRRAQVEVFDDKFITRGLFEYATRQQFKDQHSYQRDLLYLLGISLGYEDGTIMAWTEKVRHDLVRPTTVIQRWGSDKIVTYPGRKTTLDEPAADMEAKEIDARNFEAFVRVMPHSEFPSGSSCICTTFREFADEFTTHYYGEKIGNYTLDFGPNGHELNCDGEISEDLRRGWCNENYTFALKDMTELEEICGQSRLWGGMHFSKSVPGGHELCEGIGTMALDRILQITADSDFGGNEFFAGDARPTCSDPSADMTGLPAVSDSSSSSRVSFVTGLVAVVIMAFL